jgi:hypothetical protein
MQPNAEAKKPDRSDGEFVSIRSIAERRQHRGFIPDHYARIVTHGHIANPDPVFAALNTQRGEVAFPPR